VKPDAWPYRGDSPNAKLRRVAHAYRARLARVAPDECAELDTIMRRLGQHWVIPRPVTTDPQAWVSAQDAAELAAVDAATIHRLRERGRLTGRRVGVRWEYRVADILALSGTTRTRTMEEHHRENNQ